MPASVELVVIDEFRIRPLCPTPRGLVLLSRKDAHGNGNGDVFRVEKSTLIFPVKTRGRDPSIRQPIERNVVEDLVTRQFACGARGSVQSSGDRSRPACPPASSWSRSQAANPTGESAIPYKVCGRDAINLA